MLKILSREFVYLRFYFELQFVQIFRYWVLGIASPLCMYGTALGPKVLAVRIHSGGTSDTRWHDELHTEFLECMQKPIRASRPFDHEIAVTRRRRPDLYLLYYL